MRGSSRLDIVQPVLYSGIPTLRSGFDGRSYAKFYFHHTGSIPINSLYQSTILHDARGGGSAQETR